MRSLNAFKDMSGLTPSLNKSTSFFGNVPAVEKRRILRITKFEEGILPVRYLGVPLISSKLSYTHCKVLVERMENRIRDWKSKFLSFAGRLQLIISVLSSIYSYWASVFILPMKVIKDLERIMKGFLWCQGPLSKGKAKIAWNRICLPKSEGGLGIRCIADVNLALMAFHVSSILNSRRSLWVDWVNTYKLMGRSFWDVPNRHNSSWGWRNLLKYRGLFRPFFWSDIGNGLRTSLWYDTWDVVCPLEKYVTPREIARYGFSITSKVADACSDTGWNWPDQLRSKFQVPDLTLIPEKEDRVKWLTVDGSLVDVHTSTVWESIRNRSIMLNWPDVVWSKFCIPRHAFISWLICQKRLATQDRILKWERKKGSMNLMCCMLCYNGMETHSHLFFECSYSNKVWTSVRNKADMGHVQGKWSDIIDVLILKSKSKSIKAVLGRLIVAAVAYFVWQERNSRFFNNQLRPPETLVDIILETIRLKLHSYKFKDSARVRSTLEAWKITTQDLMF